MPAEQNVPETPFTRRRILWIAIGLTLLFFAMRTPSFLTPVPKVDEALYAASAARSVEFGDPLPYRASWQDKGPVVMWIYMGVFWIFGNYNMVALHLVAAAMIAFGAIAVWKVAAAASSQSGGAWAAFIYLVSMNTGNAVPFNSETPAAIITVWALAFLISIGERAEASASRRNALVAFGSGVLAGLAFLTRQNYLMLIMAFPFCIWVLVAQRHGTFLESVKLAFLNVMGFAAAFAGVVLLFVAVGEQDTFFHCFWGINHIYVGTTSMSLTRILGIPNDTMRMFLRTAQTPVIIGMFGIALVVFSQGATNLFNGLRRSVAALAGLLAIGFTLAGIFGFRFFSHYFVMAIPFWSIMAGLTLAVVLRRIGHPAIATAAKVAVVLSLALDLASTPFFETVLDSLRWGRYGGLQGRDIMESGLGINDDVARVVAAIDPYEKPGDRLFVWGFSPFFYLQTNMVPAGRIVNGCYLSGLIPWENVSPGIDTTDCIVPGAWEAQMEDLNREQPAFVIDASRHQLFASGKYPPSKFPLLARFLENGYTMVKKIGAYDLYVRNDRAASVPPDRNG